MADKGATQTTDTSGSSKELIETDAKIVWTYLNRLGLEFIKSDQKITVHITETQDINNLEKLDTDASS